MANVVYKPITSTKINNIDTAIPQKIGLLAGMVTYGIRIVRNCDFATSSLGTSYTTLYTVPAGKTFFLLGGSLSQTSDYQEVTIALVDQVGGRISQIQQYHPIDVDPEETITGLINLSSPLKFSNGETLRAMFYRANASNAWGWCSIYGYEVDNSVLSYFV